MNGGGDFAVAWSSYFGGSSEIYARRFRRNGSALTDEFPVNTTTDGNQKNPSIGMANYGSVLVAWESQGGQDGDGTGIFAQTYTTNGTPEASGELQVNSTTKGNQTSPSVAKAYTTGRGVVVWESSSDGNLNSYDIYAQRMNLNGSLVGDEILVNTTTEGYQGRPSVAMAATDDFLVAWESQGQDGSYGGIYARKFDFNGKPLSGEFLVNTTTAGAQTSPAVAAEVFDFVAAWQGPDEDADGIYTSGLLEVPEPSLLVLNMAALATLACIARRRSLPQ